MPRPDRSAHDLFEVRHREVDARLRRRIDAISDTLDLHPDVRRSFAIACERAAHLHSADCALINYEFRSGRSSPAEDEVRREEFQEREWTATLGELRDVARERRRAAEIEERQNAPAPRFRIRYLPVAGLAGFDG